MLIEEQYRAGVFTACSNLSIKSDSLLVRDNKTISFIFREFVESRSQKG